MMSRRIAAKKLKIERMGEPAQRNPVGIVEGPHRPPDRGPIQSVEMNIPGDIRLIVQVTPRMVVNLVVKRKGSRDQKQTQDSGARGPITEGRYAGRVELNPRLCTN